MLNPPMFNDSAPSNEEDGEKTWIQVYPSISGKEFSIDYVGSVVMDHGQVMKRIGEISLEEDETMNTAIRDKLMVPVTPFERHLFDIIDPETG